MLCLTFHYSFANKTKCQEMRSVKWSFLFKQWTLTHGCHFLDNLKSRLPRGRLNSSMTPTSLGGGLEACSPRPFSKLRSSTWALAEKVQTTNSLTFRMLSQTPCLCKFLHFQKSLQIPSDITS